MYISCRRRKFNIRTDILSFSNLLYSIKLGIVENKIGSYFLKSSTDSQLPRFDTALAIWLLFIGRFTVTTSHCSAHHMWLFLKMYSSSTLRPKQDYHHFANDIFKCIFSNENVWFSLKTSERFVPKVRINNNPALVQIMAWRRPGNKPLSETMMA